MSKFRISHNAPVVLTFALLAVAVHCLTYVGGNDVRLWFASWPELHDTRSYIGLVSHILGHANWQHLMGNSMLILLLGPILEERFGSFQLLVMIVLTALITGIIYLIIGNTFLQGASGIVFMMIILASTANIKQREIPLTFIAVALVYMGGEIVQAFNSKDNVAHLAHLIGGTVGGVFGFLGAKAHLLGNRTKSLDLSAAKALDKPLVVKPAAAAVAGAAKKPRV